MTLILQLPPAYAGPLLIGIMVPWGFVGWTFPPAQASRIVGHAPELANLTLPLNASAMYFGIAFGSFIGGQVLHVAPPSDLGIVAAGFPLVALVICSPSSRRRVGHAGGIGGNVPVAALPEQRWNCGGRCDRRTRSAGLQSARSSARE